MRRSSHVVAPLLASAALALLAGCKQQEMQRCVDENNHVVADNLCQQGQATVERRPDGHGGFLLVPLLYRYYYGGFGGFGLGSSVSGGGYMPSPGHSYARPTTRGGFGSTFRGGGFGGGAGE
ncbi:MAG: hypothetical protein ABI197_14305 [Granulicella sp.]